jgi:hypothetical protein
MKVVLTVIDVTGTQNFIFGSNRLRESIGASELVAQATDNWIRETLKITGKLREQAKIEEGNTDAEIVYLGGGNAVILFKANGADDKEIARKFTQEYTRKLLIEAPNLEVVVVHSSSFEWANNREILQKHKEVMKRISEKKANRSLSAPLKCLAVSAQCVSTGGTASFSPKDVLGYSEERYKTLEEKYGDNYVSGETFEKLKMVDAANTRLKTELFANINTLPPNVTNKFPQDMFFPPLGFDNLGRTEGDTSLIGVVHTDGNGMGNRIKEFGQKDLQDNRDWVTKMRAMSESIENANRQALQEMTNFLASKIDLDENGKPILKADNGKTFQLKEGEIYVDGKWKDAIFYPFRPIIFGGEDIAFICDGRIALDLTAKYLKALQSSELADGEPLYGRAGVAIVKSHYPFRRAYDLAEDLARSAKVRIREVEEYSADNRKVQAIDWHLAFTGLSGNVKEIRDREYLGGKLCLRPVVIEKGMGNSDWFLWDNFVSVTREFQDKWSENSDNPKRNKAKSLRDILRGKEEKVKQFLELNKDLKLPEVKNCEDLKNTGWFNERCGYFDSLEMMDIYFPLAEKATSPMLMEESAEVIENE